MGTRRAAALALVLLLVVGCTPRERAGRERLAPSEGAGSGRSRSVRLANDRCIRVIDGDTIHTARHGAIRFIGINAPEYDQPLYREAREAVARRVGEQEVRLEICPIQPKDKYGRWRAVVYFRQGEKWVNLNRLVVREGWARIDDFQPCHVRASQEWRADEEEAQHAGRGIWAGAGAAVKQ